MKCRAKDLAIRQLLSIFNGKSSVCRSLNTLVASQDFPVSTCYVGKITSRFVQTATTLQAFAAPQYPVKSDSVPLSWVFRNNIQSSRYASIASSGLHNRCEWRLGCRQDGEKGFRRVTHVYLPIEKSQQGCRCKGRARYGLIY